MSTRYCICRSKDGRSFMIGCEKCEEWFHGRCIGVTQKHANSIDKFYCDGCLNQNSSLAIVYKPGYSKPPEKKTVKLKQEPLEERKQDKKVLEKSQSSSSIAQPKPKPVIQTRAQPKASPSKKRVNQRVKSKVHNRKQCANPECVYESRMDSKYCSDECGYAFNKLRYENHFVTKYRILEKNHSQARIKKIQDCNKLEQDRKVVEELIKNLKIEKDELEHNIRIIKEQANKLSRENAANAKENEDEDAESNDDDVEEITSGDLSKTFCITCGMTIVSAKAFQHWSTCHKKHESSYNFTADVLVNHYCKEDENPKIYCHFQDKKTKRYCMHIESACPQHSNWQSDKDEVCGCPLNIMQKLVPDGNYCLELKKDCNQHYHWDKFRLAQINIQRAQAFTRLDVINDRIRVVAANVADTYGGVVGVMLHNTINHSKTLPEDNGHSSESPYDQDDGNAEMAVD